LKPTGFTEGIKGRASKFSDSGADSQVASSRDMNEMLGRKVLRMPEAYIKSLLGKGGETIQQIISRTGSAIRVDHRNGQSDGIVTIANNIDQAITMIRSILEARGCHWEEHETVDESGKITNVGWKGAVALQDVQIPTELVGMFVGNNGDSIQEIKNRVGGPLTIKVLPPILPGGFQVIQVVGDNWRAAREMVREKVAKIMRATPGRWHAPETAGGGAAYAGYMAGFAATPGLSISKEPQREGQNLNMVRFQGMCV
jgi:hypothetical protein